MKLTDVLKEEYETINEISKSGEIKQSSSKNAVNKISSMYKFLLKENPRPQYGIGLVNARINFLRIKYSIEDITAFSQTLETYNYEESFQEITGYFLTKLIMKHYKNEPTKREYFLVLDNVDCSINRIGLRLVGPAIVILGSVGKDVGRLMKTGSIRITGNAGETAGYEMKGGSIIIEGNTGKYTGTSMSGGKIEIKKNADDSLGTHMYGGEIHVDGTIKSIGMPFYGGKIYNREKILLEKY